MSPVLLSHFHSVCGFVIVITKRPSAEIESLNERAIQVLQIIIKLVATNYPIVLRKCSRPLPSIKLNRVGQMRTHFY